MFCEGFGGCAESSSGAAGGDDSGVDDDGGGGDDEPAVTAVSGFSEGGDVEDAESTYSACGAADSILISAGADVV